MIPVEAIQRVMENLGKKMDDANLMMNARPNVIRMEGYGRKCELRDAIILLEDVIAQYAPDNTDRADGHGEDDHRDGQEDPV
jgi:hypothetical protein